MVSAPTRLWTACSCLNAVFAFGAFVPRIQRSGAAVFSTAGQDGGVFYDGPEYNQSKQGQSESTTRSSSSNEFPSNSKRSVQNKDCVIIGGGLAGLSTALYLSQLEPDRHITILEREETRIDKTTVASFAAAGMLAPQSERLPMGPLLDLCISSRRLYPDFVDLVETLAQDEEGKEHLWSLSDDKPWSVGYVASGGFLAPAFAGDSVATWAPPEDSGSATWLDTMQVREMEPNLHPDVVGGWWFPEDASVDARRLTCSLRAACVAAGVQLQVGAEVTSLDLVDGHCKGLWLASGKYLKTKSVLVANGAWMRNLLPVPIEPHKGQSISLRMPSDQPALLRRVLFAQDTYIVPKADGRIVVGATVEAGSYDANVTPAGLMHIMAHALQLVPGLADLPLEETWVGLRPTTPDKGPILGKTPWDNLFIAGGYWRNGVLLAPKTGQLLASLLSGRTLSDSDQALLDAFAWDRFTSPEKSATLAANTRYAASMHPIHRRKSGSGVAAAVGTELGSYSTARPASEERRQDRNALFDSGGDDGAFERAAEMGRQDAGVYIFDDENTVDETTESTWLELLEQQPRRLSLPEEASFTKLPSFSKANDEYESPTNQYMDSLEAPKYEGSADAYTVPSQPDDDEYVNLSFVYDNIQKNKESRGDIEMGEAEPETREDPGFRIYHVDSETGEERQVPPFTSPEEMARLVAEENKKTKSVNGASSFTKATFRPDADNVQDDSILDGYYNMAIEEEVNADKSSQEESSKASMREARMQNRAGVLSEPLLHLDEEAPSSFASFVRRPETPEKDALPKAHADLQDVYNRIRQKKEAKSESVEMGDAPDDDDRPEKMVRMDVAEERTGTTKKGDFTTEEPTESAPKEVVEYSEQTFDGYQDIQQANSRTTREEELEAMRAARQQNRVGSPGGAIDETKIGVHGKNEE
jgi:thiazole synthase